MKTRQSQAGQAGLVVMLIMVVLLTLGISITTRSTSDVIQSTQEQETSRVFDAAEAGIEQALSSALTASTGTVEDIGDNLAASYTVEEVNSLDVRLDEGHVVEVDLTNYIGNVTIDWSLISDCAQDPASLEVIIYDSSANSVRREAYEGCTHGGDGFIPDSGSAASPFAFRISIPVSLSEDSMRIKPVYNDTHLRVTGGVDFPRQYHRITSEARNTATGETRVVVVDRTIPTAPGIFDFVLFAGAGSIAK